MTSQARIAELLTQTHWVRGLARSLAADLHQAEDLAQDAWVAALEHPPRTERSGEGRSARGWLATVLRNRWSDLRTERGRREARERVGARDEALDSTHELVERASIQRQLVGAVLELDEPYRSTVLLRFFEGLPQREIARRMRTTTATVNSRLTRALDKLRERLSRQGGASAWLRVLIPLVSEPTVAPTLALGVAVKSLVIAIAVVFSLVGGFWYLRTSSDLAAVESSAPVVAAQPDAAKAHAPSPSGPAHSTEPGERELIAGRARRAEPDSPSAAAPTRVVRGRVLDTAGLGVAGIAVELGASGPVDHPPSSSGVAACISGANGWFEIELAAAADTIVCADPRFETVLAGSARVEERTTPTVVVAPRIEVHGLVVDERSQPLAGAWIELGAPRGFGADWGLVLDYSLPRRWIARSQPDGRFALPVAPAIAGATLRASLGGFAPHVESGPTTDVASVQIVLRRPRVADGLVRGIVIDPLGRPIEGACVSAGASSSLSDREGAFELDVAQDDTRSRMLAVKRGYLPAVLEPETRDAKLAWPDRVVLQLGDAARGVRGRVVDRTDAPVAGAKVWIDDPTYFGVVGDTRLAAEPMIAGDERFWSFVLADADGEFELQGLLPDRSYRLEAIDPRTLASGSTESVRTDDAAVEIELETDDLHERIAGRVLSRRGEPLAGVRVRVFRETFAIEHSGGKDNEVEERPAIVTQADGAFEFLAVPKRDVWVVASGDAILSEGLDLAAEADPLGLEIVVSQRVHLQVELDEPIERASAISFQFVDGRRAWAQIMRAGGSHMASRFELVGGRSEVLAVDEQLATLVLHRGDTEVARVALSLRPGELNVVRY